VKHSQTALLQSVHIVHFKFTNILQVQAFVH